MAGRRKTPITPTAISILRGFLRTLSGDQLAPGDLAGLSARKAERPGHRLAEGGIAGRGEDEPEGRLVDRPVFMTFAELVDQLVDGIEDRVERVAIAGKDHPGGERAGAFLAEGIEGAVHDGDRIDLAGPALLHRFGNPGADPVADQRGKRRLEPRRRTEMMKQVRMRLADLRRHRLQSHGLGAMLDQESPRRLEGSRSTFLGRETLTSY